MIGEYFKRIVAEAVSEALKAAAELDLRMAREADAALDRLGP